MAFVFISICIISFFFAPGRDSMSYNRNARPRELVKQIIPILTYDQCKLPVVKVYMVTKITFYFI